MQTDVQLFAGAVELNFTIPGELRQVVLTSNEFEAFAAQVAEAALNKRGYEQRFLRASDIRPGDRLIGLEVKSVKPDDNGTHSNIRLGRNGDSTLHQANSYFLRVERPIS